MIHEHHMAVQHRVVPHAPLSAFVALLWSYEGDTPSQAKERRLPDGAMGLVINLRDDLTRVYDRRQPDQFQSYRGSVISGAHSVFTILDSTGPAHMLGVEFKPGGALPFLGLPSAELHNQVISLETIWGASAQRLRDDLLAAATPARRFALLEEALLARLRPERVAHPAVGYALAALQSAPQQPSMAAVTERIGLSQTRFIQVFREAVGLTPKQYCRVRRFQHVLRAGGRRARHRGRASPGLRLLRPGPLHPRLPGIRWPDPHRLSRPARRASQPYRAGRMNVSIFYKTARLPPAILPSEAIIEAHILKGAR